MRWQLGRRSDNVQDRRGVGMGGAAAGGGIGVVLLSLLVTMCGGDPSILWQQNLDQSGSSYPGQVDRPAAENQLADFVSVVLADTEDVWNGLFQQSGGQYVEPQLVLFTGSVQSACGYAQAASGPFYCPRDQKVYIDLNFYDQLKNQLNAPGDFAQAYVIAHEVGHHVQNQLGILNESRALQSRMGQAEANRVQVMVELQADCFAGVWSYHAEQQRQILEPGDIEEALNAAAQIGDDTLQRRSQGYIVPDSFTHGTAAQRASWFKRGLQTGDPAQCDTFNASRL